MRQEIPQPCAAQLPYSLARLDWVEDPAHGGGAGGHRRVAGAIRDAGRRRAHRQVRRRQPSPAGRLSAERDDPRRRRDLALGAALREPASRLDTTPATLAVAFTLLHPRTASTLIGATAPAQIDAALAAVSLAERLTAADVAELRELAAGVV